MRECFLVNVANNLSLSGKSLKLERVILIIPLQISLWNIEYFKKYNQL